MNRVIVLHASLAGHWAACPLTGLVGHIAYAKRLELERASATARQASLLGIELAMQAITALAGHRPPVRDLRFPAGGKPFLPGGPSFSISHCRQHVAVAASADCEVGIDIEDRGGKGSAGGGTRPDLWRWVAIEATLKAAGCGLRSASRVALNEDTRRARLEARDYRLTPLELDPAVLGCVATSADIDRWEIKRCS